MYVIMQKVFCYNLGIWIFTISTSLIVFRRLRIHNQFTIYYWYCLQRKRAHPASKGTGEKMKKFFQGFIPGQHQRQHRNSRPKPLFHKPRLKTKKTHRESLRAHALTSRGQPQGIGFEMDMDIVQRMSNNPVGFNNFSKARPPKEEAQEKCIWVPISLSHLQKK